MKRFLSALAAVVMVMSIIVPGAYAQENRSTDDLRALGIDTSHSVNVRDVVIRDPFVLVSGGIYYMYGTDASTVEGYGCYVSLDLETWYGPVNVFEAKDGFDGVNCFWAPECHYYNGSYYLLASYGSASTGHRGTSVFRSSSPLGPFEEISDGHITPHDWDSIDGTLYVEDGVPYMIFVHEWTSMPDGVGDISFAQLSPDLTHFVTEPETMFRADDCVWASDITDGPFLYKTQQGTLIMLWSSGSKLGYSVGSLFSLSGQLRGSWHFNSIPLYQRRKSDDPDGGHGMIFTANDGRLLMAIHSPNSGSPAHPVFIEMVEKDGTLVKKDKFSSHVQASQKIDQFFWRAVEWFKIMLFPKMPLD